MRHQMVLALALACALQISCDPVCNVVINFSVTDESGNPVEDALLEERACCGVDSCTRTTDHAGAAKIEYSTMGPGNCEVRVSKTGFETVSQAYTHRVVAPGNVTAAVQIILEPSK